MIKCFNLFLAILTIGAHTEQNAKQDPNIIQNYAVTMIYIVACYNAILILIEYLSKKRKVIGLHISRDLCMHLRMAFAIIVCTILT